MSLTLYLTIAIVTMAGFHWASAKSMLATRTKRTIFGTGLGAGSYGIFSEWTSTLDILDASIEGRLGVYGFVFASGFFVLVSIWGWNLFTTRKFLVR